MKVLAFNGSPKAAKGSTELILRKFMEGAASAGAETETVYPAKLKINFCTGCFNCWLKHPGRCIHQDDMAGVLDKIKRAGVLVFASPVYVDGVTAQLKVLMDRCISGAQPFIEVKDGHSRHPGRGKGAGPRKKTVLVSCCGFGEVDNFEPMVHHIKAASKNMQAEFLGALLRPMGPLVEVMDKGAPAVLAPIYEGFFRAGREAVEAGAISEEAKKAASKPIMTMEQYMTMANTFFKSEINRQEARNKKGP